ncbi:MAG: aldehyde dehydrogenase family protein [Ilumatobacteraceae bacterium]
MEFTTTPIDDIAPKVAAARSAFEQGATKPAVWRVATLERLRSLLVEREGRLLDALAADFGKPRAEAWATEIGFTISDINHTLAHLPRWMKSRRVGTPVAFQPGSSHIVPEPVGVACVIAPWNYPVQLLLVPMVAAIAAGNAVVAKPSELAPHAAAELVDLIEAIGDPAVVAVQGGVAETTELLAQRFDHILYTGNSRVARIVMRAAAEHLTPVTLELGGKSPAIVSRNANIDVAGRRIAWGKFVNAGQTCIAPDYVLVERSVHDQLVAAIGKAVESFYGSDVQASADYTRIVNDPHFHRIEKMLHCGTVAVGGESDPDTRYIAPTVLTGITKDDPVMAEEIFGPVLPVIAVDSLDDAISFVNEGSAQGDKPLALYSFSESDDENDKVIGACTSGGACVNGTLLHISNPNLPFGGVGESGMGAYHGKFGFDTFSHQRSVHSRSTKLDPALMYPPYTEKKEKILRKGMTMPDPRDAAAKARGWFSRS